MLIKTYSSEEMRTVDCPYQTKYGTPASLKTKRLMRMAVSMLGEGNNDVWSMNNSKRSKIRAGKLHWEWLERL